MSEPPPILDYSGSDVAMAGSRRLSRLAVATFVLSIVTVITLFDNRIIGTLLASELGGSNFLLEDEHSLNVACAAWAAPVVLSMLFGFVALRFLKRRRPQPRGVLLIAVGIILCAVALGILVFLRSQVQFPPPPLG